MIRRRALRFFKGDGRNPKGIADGGSLQALDLLVSGISSAVAVYAAATSLASERNAGFFTWIVIVGTLISFLVVYFLGKKKFIGADATFYSVISLVTVLGIAQLNLVVPDQLYTGPLVTAGVLSWMLALGSMTVWRDQTMLFQAVPAVALFGLVGCYDTFHESVYYFFVFLTCQAILLSRAHGRAMLRQARSSSGEALEMSAMRRGPWRWMAGPEWALGSALTIVLVSVVGAPLLRASASGFSGLVKYSPPVSSLTAPSFANNNSAGSRVGTGPNVVRETPVLRAKLPEPMYLRSNWYGRYDRGLWTWTPRGIAGGSRDAASPRQRNLGIANNSDPQEITFRIEPIQLFGGSVPAPGEVTDLLGESANVYMRNGGMFTTHADQPIPPLVGHAIIFGGRSKITDSATGDVAKVMPDWVGKDGIPAEVSDWARKVTKNAGNDYHKALALQHAIERMAKYNLNAAATPSDVDPVAYFLFESKEGYCDLFASAMVLGARSIGLPARYVTGYYPFNTELDSQGRYTIRQKDAHAWCEILFKNAGWVVFDATEGAASVDGGGLGSANEFAFWNTPWFKGLSALLVLGGSGYFGIRYGRGLLAYRRSPRYAEVRNKQAASRLRNQIGREYLAFEREVRRAVRRARKPAETIAEYLGSAQAKLGSSAVEAAALGGAFSAALYAPVESHNESLQSLKAELGRFKRVRRGKPA